MVRISDGAAWPPVRSTATELTSDTNDQRPPEVTATPNGPPGTDSSEVPALPSERACAVAVVHPGTA